MTKCRRSWAPFGADSFSAQGITVRVRPHVVVDALHKGHVVAALGEFGFHDSDVAVTIESEKVDEPASEAACGGGLPPGGNLRLR